MTHPLTNLAKANWDKKRIIIALVVVIIILLLLWLRKGPNTTTVNNSNVGVPGLTLGPIELDPTIPVYDLPPLTTTVGANPSLWDWIQSCDSACNCDELGFVAPLPVQTYPVYEYVSSPSFYSAPVETDFPMWTPPPTKTFWMAISFAITNWEWNYANNQAERQAGMVPVPIYVTQDGKRFSTDGKWHYFDYRVQLDESLRYTGDYLYVDGKRYTHDYSKDS